MTAVAITEEEARRAPAEALAKADVPCMIDFVAVPEPGTLTLAGLGLAVLLAAARRCNPPR